MRCISILPDFFDFVDDPLRRVGHGQRRDVAGEQRPPCGVGEQFARRLHGPCGRFGVGDQNGSLPVYGKAVSPLGPYRQGPGEMNVPVVCGGQVVMPGDILVGDRDGIVVIPRQEAAELLEAARKNLQDEQEAMARMKAGTFPVEEHLESFTGSFLRRGGELI